MSFNTRTEANALAFAGLITTAKANSYAHVESATAELHYGHLVKMIDSFGLKDAAVETAMGWPAGSIASVRAQAKANTASTLGQVLGGINTSTTAVKPVSTAELLNQAASKLAELSVIFNQMAVTK